MNTYGTKPCVMFEFEVEKIIDISSDGSYQVQWSPAWVSGSSLVGCKHLIEEFHKRKAGNEANEYPENQIEMHMLRETDNNSNRVRIYPQEQSEKDGKLPNESHMLNDSRDCDELVLTPHPNVLLEIPDISVKIEDHDHDHDEVLQMNISELLQESNGQSASKSKGLMEVETTHLETQTLTVAKNLPESTVLLSTGSGNSLTLKNEIVEHLKDARLIGEPQDDEKLSASVKTIPSQHISILSEGELYQQRQNAHRTTCSATRFVCPYCPNTFNRKDDLNVHIRFHTDEKLYWCNECDFVCISKENLLKHMRVHTGEKPCICNICGTSFTRRASLKVHSRIHSGEKPFPCDVCAKSFTVKGDLNKHFRTHTGIKPYSCGVCRKTFANISNRNSHMKRCSSSAASHNI